MQGWVRREIFLLEWIGLEVIKERREICEVDVLPTLRPAQRKAWLRAYRKNEKQTTFVSFSICFLLLQENTTKDLPRQARDTRKEG